MVVKWRRNCPNCIYSARAILSPSLKWDREIHFRWLSLCGICLIVDFLSFLLAASVTLYECVFSLYSFPMHKSFYETCLLVFICDFSFAVCSAVRLHSCWNNCVFINLLFIPNRKPARHSAWHCASPLALNFQIVAKLSALTLFSAFDPLPLSMPCTAYSSVGVGEEFGQGTCYLLLFFW